MIFIIVLEELLFFAFAENKRITDIAFLERSRSAQNKALSLDPVRYQTSNRI